MNKVSFMGLIALFLSLMPLQGHAQEWLATFLVLTEWYEDGISAGITASSYL